MRYYDLYRSPHGAMLLVADASALTGVYFERQKYHPMLGPDWCRDPNHPPLRQVARELDEYFAGRRRRFETPLAPHGTPFQSAIWRAIAAVPFGSTITYRELAHSAGFDGSARAAGAATGRNPLSIVVPCHRIVGSNGSLTGYAGGLARKRALLEHEGALALAIRSMSVLGSARSERRERVLP